MAQGNSRPMVLRGIACGIAALGLVGMLPTGAQAQLLNQLKGAIGGSDSSSSGGALGSLGGGVPSVDKASTSNIAGVLQYCVKNNYVNGASASSVKDSIVSKVTGSGKSAGDSGFKAGESGKLQTGNGSDVSLGSGGVKDQVTHKVCDMVLQHAKSLI